MCLEFRVLVILVDSVSGDGVTVPSEDLDEERSITGETDHHRLGICVRRISMLSLSLLGNENFLMTRQDEILGW